MIAITIKLIVGDGDIGDNPNVLKGRSTHSQKNPQCKLKLKRHNVSLNPINILAVFWSFLCCCGASDLLLLLSDRDGDDTRKSICSAACFFGQQKILSIHLFLSVVVVIVVAASRDTIFMVAVNLLADYIRGASAVLSLLFENIFALGQNLLCNSFTLTADVCVFVRLCAH